MAETRNQIRFILNDRDIVLGDVRSADTLLDFLRLDERLKGTKEGCAEGDCGACTVLVGRLAGGELIYETVNACIRFVASLDGCHVVTVEHLAGRNGTLHPVQQALVDMHGSQCGFCTPGFVMSLYGLWMRSAKPNTGEIEQALQGNLCRCTGYEPIVAAARKISDYGTPDRDPLVTERASIAARLADLQDGARVEIEQPDGDKLILPADVDDLAMVLVDHPDATIVAGATDVGLWVPKFMQDISPAVFISHLTELHEIEEADDGITIGAGVTYSELEAVIARRFPDMHEFWSRIGGEQVRNMGTVGGNIANGSPIGDTPPALIALGASITLRRGSERRTVQLDDFFIDYGKQDRRPDEFVERVHIPFPGKNDKFAVYKISKRRDEDISSVCGAFRVTLDKGVVSDAVIAFGGMAATPKRARSAETALVGKSWTEAAALDAQGELARDFSPISDWRASADYRALVSGNLMRRFWLETAGEPVRLEREAVV